MSAILLYFIFFALFTIFAVIVFFISNSLVLSEYTQTGSCEIVYYAPLQYLFLFLVVVAALSLITGILLRYNTKIFLKRKQFKMFYFTLICASLVILGSSMFFAFSNSYCYTASRKILDDVEQPSNEIPAQYMIAFPFIEKMDSMFSEQGANYYFSEQITPFGKYIHAQNYSASNNAFFVYDMEFFESNRYSLINAFYSQKNHIVNNYVDKLKFKEKRKIDDIDYTVYQYENFYYFIVENNNHCFSVVFDNIDDLYDEPCDFETLSLNIYYEITRIKEPSINVTIWEEIVAGIGDGMFDFDAISWYAIS